MATVKTLHRKKLIDEDTATAFYFYLRDNIEWEDGVRSSKGFKRKAKAINFGDDECLDAFILDVFQRLDIPFIPYGIYLNYYRNGDDFTPNHTHKDTKQLIISLGASRTFMIGKKELSLENGDTIIFGSSIHGVPKEPTCTEGRISIAIFLPK